MVKENHRYNYFRNKPEKTMNVFAHYYDKDNVCGSEDLQDMIEDHEKCRKFWDDKLNRLLPILMRRFSDIEMQIFYSCVMSHQQYTQTHVTQFVTYKDSEGNRQYFTQAAVNHYIRRIKKAMVLEDEYFDWGIQFTKEVKSLLRQTKDLLIKFRSGEFKSKSKILTLKKIKRELKRCLQIVAIEKKLKERQNIDTIRTKINLLKGYKVVKQIISDKGEVEC